MIRRVGLLGLLAATLVVVAGCGLPVIGGVKDAAAPEGSQEAANAAFIAQAGDKGFDAINCDGTIAVMAPYGGFGPTDTVQMNWARVALDTFNRDHGTAYTFEPFNVDFDVEAGRAAAQAIVANQDIVGVVGPKTSVVTKEVGPILDGAGMVYVSPSATNATLTDGSLRHFYRVVASDALQGPAIGAFIVDDLNPSTVLIVRGDEPYSQGLVGDIERVLGERGVRYEIVDVTTGQRDFSEVVTRVNESVNVVAMPLLVATDATLLYRQLYDAGKYPKIVGGDALFVKQFKAPGAFVTTYAPDVSAQPAGADTVRLYESIFGDFEAFGGPAYIAMEAMLTAATTTCAEKGSVTRSGIANAMPGVVLEETILGQRVAFDERHELVGASIQVYRIGSRGFELVE